MNPLMLVFGILGVGAGWFTTRDSDSSPGTGARETSVPDTSALSDITDDVASDSTLDGGDGEIITPLAFVSEQSTQIGTDTIRQPQENDRNPTNETDYAEEVDEIAGIRSIPDGESAEEDEPVGTPMDVQRQDISQADELPPIDLDEIAEIIEFREPDPVLDPLDLPVGNSEILPFEPLQPTTPEAEPLVEPDTQVQPIGGVPGAEIEGFEEYAATYGLPSLDPDDYDNVIFGKTFTSTLKLDEGDDNTLIIGCKFVDIDGHGIDIRNVSNVVIADNSFEDIEGTAVRFRSSGSTEDCAVISNEFDDIGLNAISSAKRSESDVDHEGLVVHGNEIGDTGFNGNNTAHAIYVQSSGAQVSANKIVGEVDANAISVRGDGAIFDNYIDVTTTDKYGSGIKYYSDHKTGPSKELLIENNYIDGNNSLYSGVEIKMAGSAIPRGVDRDDWVVNDFEIAGNSVKGASNKLVIDNKIADASWSDIKLSNPVNGAVNASELLLSDVIPLTGLIEEQNPNLDDEQDLDLIA